MKFDFFIYNSLSKRFEKGFLRFLIAAKRFLKTEYYRSFRMRYLSI
ncbi:hypothetical protein HPHPA26_0820 [Helicobacter pylori Hp A-26]|uniref:Uncharacterized protein n=1 Tax=Helicobacter pylori Hp A-26 TaxID=992056 RepID=J0MRX4_HELPX|nr:hypothetical protein HPHPA26_0820 [Helicobacter pylori Hp A-26]